MKARPLPQIDPDNQPYFVVADDLFQIPRCTQCALWNFYPRTHCRRCLTSQMEWQAASPFGTVYSFAVIHRPQHEFFYAGVPFTMVVANMDDGFQLIASAEEVPATMKIGDRVRVVRKTIDDARGISLPVFRQVAHDSSS